MQLLFKIFILLAGLIFHAQCDTRKSHQYYHLFLLPNHLFDLQLSNLLTRCLRGLNSPILRYVKITRPWLVMKNMKDTWSIYLMKLLKQWVNSGKTVGFPCGLCDNFALHSILRFQVWNANRSRWHVRSFTWRKMEWSYRWSTGWSCNNCCRTTYYYQWTVNTMHTLL